MNDQTPAADLSISVVGAGTVGAHLVRALQRTRHTVRLAARDRTSTKVHSLVSETGVEVVPLAEAGPGADLVVLAVPYPAVVETVRALGDLGGASLVDATNTVAAALPDGADSVVDVIGSIDADLSVVKAFNTIGAEAYTSPTVEGVPLFLPVAGDQPAADAVCRVACDIGFDALVIGDRTSVPLIESFAALWIHLAFEAGLGRDFGFARLLRRTSASRPPDAST
jgi:predicted dinucleotide-binding enzyme